MKGCEAYLKLCKTGTRVLQCFRSPRLPTTLITT